MFHLFHAFHRGAAPHGGEASRFPSGGKRGARRAREVPVVTREKGSRGASCSYPTPTRILLLNPFFLLLCLGLVPVEISGNFRELRAVLK